MYCYILFVGSDAMQILINNSSMVPIYEQIVAQIKKLILNNILHENDMLPSVRALSKELKISALTVKKAYDTLEEEGFCTTIHGKGTFVLSVDPNLMKEEQIIQIQNEFEKTIQKAKAYNVSKKELEELFEILMEDMS